jgi:hypothetical protein
MPATLTVHNEVPELKKLLGLRPRPLSKSV